MQLPVKEIREMQIPFRRKVNNTVTACVYLSASVCVH